MSKGSVIERFSNKAINVIMLAQEEARRLGHFEVSDELLLLGLIGEQTGAAAQLLQSKGVNLLAASSFVDSIFEILC